MADYLNIAGRVRTTASDGVAMEAQEVKDLNQNKSQQEINADVQTELGDRYTKEETYSKEQLDELITTPDVNYVSVVATDATTAVTDVLPATGEANTIYRVGNWNGTQYDPTMYALYAWNGSAYVCLAVRSFVGEVYDISVNHPDGQGNPTPYADLAAALGTSGANIPADIRCGGMSVKFVRTYDNKYVQYRYMGTATTGSPDPFLDTANWQGVDDNPAYGDNDLVKSNGVYNADYENAVLVGINAKALGVDSLVPFSGSITGAGYWERSTSAKHRLFYVKNGDSIYIKAGAAGAIYALLKSYTNPALSTSADLCSGETRVVVAANSDVTITAPSDAKFIYVLYDYNNTDYSPVEFTINGVDVFGIDNVLGKFSKTNNEISGLNTKITQIKQDYDNNIIKEYKCTLAGTSTSKVVFKSPIILSKNGDELEILAAPVPTNTTDSMAFASRGNGTYAIQLGQSIVGIRAADNTWLFSSLSFTQSKLILMRIVYADSKIYTYINGTLVNTYNSQKTIQINSLGDGGGGTYDYWAGIVHYVKYNGSNLLVQDNVSITNVITQTIYQWEGMALPKGVLSFTYDVTSPYFTFYSQLGNSNKYFGFNVKLDVDDTDLVYLKEWRLSSGGYYEYINGEFIRQAYTINSIENEFTMHFSSKADFTGGIHGDERIDVDNTCFAKFFADGKLITNLSGSFVLECESFTYFQKSTLHETSADSGTFVSGHPIIAYHLKKNEFRNCGFHLENVIQFTSSQSVSQFFAGLLCVHKQCATYALLPAMIATSELTGTNNTIDADDNNARVIEMWNPSINIKARVEARILEGYNDPEQITNFEIWDRTNDTKYYRYTTETKTFASNDVIRNEQDVQFY